MRFFLLWEDGPVDLLQVTLRHTTRGMLSYIKNVTLHDFFFAAFFMLMINILQYSQYLGQIDGYVSKKLIQQVGL